MNNKKSIAISVLIVLVINILIKPLSIYSNLAISLTIQQLIMLINIVGKQIPFRNLFTIIMCMQMLFFPALVYSGLEEYQAYKMRVSENVYFSFVLPAILFFIVGLHYRAINKGEEIDTESIAELTLERPRLAVHLIIIGLACSFVTDYFPAEIRFILYVLSGLKFIGLFLIIIGDIRLKLKILILVYGTILISSFRQAMFHDLIIWLIMLGSILAIRYKPSFKKKLIGVGTALLFIIILQSIKGAYRQALQEGQEASLETVNESFNSAQTSNNGIFNIENIAPQVARYNQGWIIASILNHVPKNIDYSKGETILLYLEAAFLPRFIAPNKIEAGDKQVFNKYSGHYLREGTSMALSSIGDAYINFGIVGGWIFMFCYGLLFNFTLKRINVYAKKYPVLILFSTLIFVYPIRVECELQTILGHLLKSAFIMFVIFKFFGARLKIQESSG